MKPGSKKKIAIKLAEFNRLKELMAESDHLELINKSLDHAQSTKLAADIREFRKKILSRLKALKAEMAAAREEEAAQRTRALQPLIKMIQRDCKTYVDAYRAAGKALYRGSSAHGDAYVGRSWEKRLTLDSPGAAQEYYDFALDQMGITAKRANSIFATSTVNQASNYGKLYAIFPKDSAAFSWAAKPAGKDITLAIDLVVNKQFLDVLSKSVKAYLIKAGKDPHQFSIYDLVWEEKYSDLIRALKDIRYPDLNRVTMDALVDVDKIKKKYGPTDQDLIRAIRSGHEVLISGEYYAVSWGHTSRTIFAALGLKHPRGA